MAAKGDNQPGGIDVHVCHYCSILFLQVWLQIFEKMGEQCFVNGQVHLQLKKCWNSLWKQSAFVYGFIKYDPVFHFPYCKVNNQIITNISTVTEVFRSPIYDPSLP